MDFGLSPEETMARVNTLSDEQIKGKLQREAGVWLDEGRMFGRGGEGFQRLNLACPRSILSNALERMAHAFAEK